MNLQLLQGAPTPFLLSSACLLTILKTLSKFYVKFNSIWCISENKNYFKKVLESIHLLSAAPSAFFCPKSEDLMEGRSVSAPSFLDSYESLTDSPTTTKKLAYGSAEVISWSVKVHWDVITAGWRA